MIAVGADHDRKDSYFIRKAILMYHLTSNQDYISVSNHVPMNLKPGKGVDIMSDRIIKTTKTSML